MLQRISRHVRGNAVAYVALFIALGGTAVASSLKLAANSVGTAQLKNGAVTGRKVARRTLTGANIRASTLGTVPRARNATNATHAVSATTAVSATDAVNATNATHAVDATTASSATNAAQLGGQPPASFQSRVSGTCTSGSAIASIGAAGTVACQSTNVTQMMGGITQITPTGTLHYLAGEGLTPTPAPTAETNGLGTSALPGTAGNLVVDIFTLQPVELTFTLDVNDSSTALRCTIPVGGSTCSDSTDTASIPAGALVDLQIAEGGTGVATQLSFGWTDTTSG